MRALLPRILFIGSLVAFLLCYLIIDGSVGVLYSGTHFAVVGLSLLHIARAPRFNLGVSFSFFNMFFFGLIPLLEYPLRVTYHGASLPSDSSYLSAAGLALASSVFFYAGYGLERTVRRDRIAVTGGLEYRNRLHHQLLRGLTVFGVIVLPLCIAAYYEFDLGGILFRGVGEQIRSSAFEYSLVNYFVRPLLFNLVFLMMLVRINGARGLGVVGFLCCVLLLVFVSPIGIPRSLAGALYIPLVMLVFSPRLVSKYGVLCVVIFALLVIAPVADVFRFIQLNNTVNLFANFDLDYFFAGHFDAFHNLVQAIELNFSSTGFQITGALLFWIPRAVWPGKPVGTSFQFAEFAGFGSGNISFPLAAELFVDYGVLGVIGGMFILGLIYKRVDNWFLQRRGLTALSAYARVIGHFELSILNIYLLRGSVLTSFAFTVGVASTLIVLLIVNGALRNISKGIATHMRATG